MMTVSDLIKQNANFKFCPGILKKTNFRLNKNLELHYFGKMYQLHKQCLV